MFEITEETRKAAIEAMLAIIYDHDPDAQLDNQIAGEAFDAAVKIVMKQFGL
jgi:hypothetical protein